MMVSATILATPGFIPASVEFGLRHPKYGPALFHDLEAILENYRLE